MLDPTTSADMQAALMNLQLSPDREENVHAESDDARSDWEAAISSDDEGSGELDAFHVPAILSTPPRSPARPPGAASFRSPAPSSACSAFTPGPQSARSAGAGLPPRSGQATHSSGSCDTSVSAGKYVPPAQRNGGALTPPAARSTLPASPQRTGGSSSGVSSSPYGYLSPQPQSISGSQYHSPGTARRTLYPKPSPGKPPLGHVTPTRPSVRQSLSEALSPNVPPTSPSSQSSALTPNTYIMNSTSRAVPSSQKSCVSVYRHGENSPGGTPEKLTPGGTDVTKTAIKRAVHDAKAAGLTFNQKKHRSPSHLRRSQRRQQERFATGSMPSKMPSSRLDGKENTNFVDPWEAENDPCVTQEFAKSSTRHDSARQQLDFERRPSTTSIRSFR